MPQCTTAPQSSATAWYPLLILCHIITNMTSASSAGVPIVRMMPLSVTWYYYYYHQDDITVLCCSDVIVLCQGIITISICQHSLPMRCHHQDDLTVVCSLPASRRQDKHGHDDDDSLLKNPKWLVSMRCVGTCSGQGCHFGCSIKGTYNKARPWTCRVTVFLNKQWDT